MKRRIAALLGFIFTVGATANAMPIEQFDRLSASDQNRYLALLAQGASKALYDRGDIHGGDKLVQILDDKGQDNGEHQFFKYLQEARLLNQKNAANPNSHSVYEVEHAFDVLLKNNGISPLPIPALLAINKDFKPTSPLK